MSKVSNKVERLIYILIYFYILG